MLPNIPSLLEEKTTFINGDQKCAFISGFLLGIRLSRVLITKELNGEWTTGLHALAAETYMGLMRNDGCSRTDFMCGLSNGSNHTVGLSRDAFPHPELMEGRIGTQYAQGIFEGVNAIYQDGMKHFINGISFSREDGPPAYQRWIDQQEELVATLLIEHEQAQQN